MFFSLLWDPDLICSKLTPLRLGGTRDEIAAEAGRTEAAYAQAMKQVEELSTLAQVSLCFYSPEMSIF